MLIKFNFYISIICIFRISTSANDDIKSSLAFVIDSTMSMHEEIEQVKREANRIFDTVMKSEKSQIEDFVLVIFRDPDVHLLTVTKDREEFKRKLASIELIGNYDCPEMSMAGIIQGLEASRPGSMLYVFTDAAAKDAEKYERVKSLALQKGAQVIFLLTGVCPPYDDGNSAVYSQLAEATNGEVFDLSKNDIEAILKYVEENIKERKTHFVKQTFPPGNHAFNYTVDSNMKELVISIKGKDPIFNIYDPDGYEADTEEFVRTSKTVILKVNEVKTGVYKATVSSTTETKIDVTGTDTMQFKIGFSKLQPSCIEETASSPLPDEECYLSIKLEAEGIVELQSVQLMDLDQNIISESNLELISPKDKFYITEPFLPPSKSFRVVIRGYDIESKSIITRLGLIPLESQDLAKVKIVNKAPVVTSIGSTDFFADYEKPLDIKCRVSGYPKPDITWEDSDGVVTIFEVSTVEIPYDYVSILNIDAVTKNNTFKCKARNDLGEDSKTISVKTIRTNYFDIIETPKDAAIKFNGEAKFHCKINAAPPAPIKWFREKRKIKNGEHYHISKDGTVLTVKNMEPEIAGMFACRARNNKYSKRFRFLVSITGIVKPKIDKRIKEIRVKEGSTAKISCNVTEGKPNPKITWHFKSIQGSPGKQISGGETIVIKNVNLGHYGKFRCRAENSAGADYHYIDFIVEYPPIIVKNPKKSLVVYNEETVNLPCKVYGDPQPDIKWFYNGIEIKDSEFHVHKMKLSFKALVEYSGVYNCEAVNKHGKTSSSPFDVKVILPVKIEPPAFSTIEVNIGEPVTLPCNANGYPSPTIKWIFHNINFNPPIKVISNVDTNLVLPRTQVDQEGNYTCIANNQGSSANITYEVKVFAPPSIVTLSPSNVFTGIVGDLVTRIPCKSIGSPKPDITWSYDGFIIPTGTKWYDIAVDGTLSIKNITDDSAGTYTCYASNKRGVDNKAFIFNVMDYPLPGNPAITVTIEEGTSANIPCDIKPNLIDSMRWYKDKTLIMNGELSLTYATRQDAGLYTCRVCNLYSSKSSHTLVMIGTKPKFVHDVVETDIPFVEDKTVVLDCTVTAEPMPEVTWWHDSKQIINNRMTLILHMKSNNRGTYFCMAKNKFGSKVRSFEILSDECRLNVESDFGLNQPLILLPDLSLPSYDLIDGFARIPSNKQIRLQCPDEFKNIKDTKVTCTCEKDKRFRIYGETYEYDDLICKDEFEPIAVKTETPCYIGYTEMISIGYEVGDNFLNIYDVCLELNKNVPIYAKYLIDKSAADIDLKDMKWFESDLLDFDFDKMYDCKHQAERISAVLHKDFHKNDSCCFSRRQLVPPRDMSPGLPQIATFSTLNVVPHWSTCSMKNWESIEHRVRKLAKSSDVPLAVWTGTSDKLRMKISGYKLDIRLTDQHQEDYQPVPLYLWKVVQNPATNSSLAIIQVNVPDLNLKNAYQYIKCKDICREIVWMHSDRWRDVTRGYTYCCNIKEFQTAFGLVGVFDRNMDDILSGA